MKNFFVLILSVLLIGCVFQPQEMMKKESKSSNFQVKPMNSEEFTSEKGTSLKINGFSKNPEISSPIMLTGKIEKGWVFEGEFMVVVLGDKKEKIKEYFGTAEIFTPEGGIKEGMVDFEINFEFEIPENVSNGFLRIGSSNASGEEANDDWIDIPVKF